MKFLAVVESPMKINDYVAVAAGDRKIWFSV
jgi:hypothetical protein